LGTVVSTEGGRVQVTTQMGELRLPVTLLRLEPKTAPAHYCPAARLRLGLRTAPAHCCPAARLRLELKTALAHCCPATGLRLELKTAPAHGCLTFHCVHHFLHGRLILVRAPPSQVTQCWPVGPESAAHDVSRLLFPSEPGVLHHLKTRFAR
jgi:hypothetical protein